MYDLPRGPRKNSRFEGVIKVTHQNTNPNAALPLRSTTQTAIKAGAVLGLCALVALSAVVVKAAVGPGRATLGSLAGVTTTSATETPALVSLTETKVEPAVTLSEVHDPLTVVAAPAPAPAPVEVKAPVDTTRYAASTDVRYFNGRPIRPARTIKMTVTAYSPDEKSCGPDARGITSSLHHVKTNAMKMVAADSKVLPLGSMISVPGYDSGNIVPVLDRGGAIKGNKLDVLFPTDAAARKWGVKKLDVVVWEYADNLPADDYRAIRDSKN
jgi:3D (Asp-Asp-Asp) domain-containing protein